MGELVAPAPADRASGRAGQIISSSTCELVHIPLWF
jgi:hypothetical protein